MTSEWILRPTDEALWRTTVPLVVLLAVSETKRPRLLSVWIGVRWLSALNPAVAGWTGRDIARAARIRAAGIAADLQELERRGLIERKPCAGLGPVSPQRYSTTVDLLARLERASLAAYPSLMARFTPGHATERSDR